MDIVKCRESSMTALPKTNTEMRHVILQLLNLVCVQRSLLCAQQHPVPGEHAHRIGGDSRRLHQGKYPAEA